MDEEVPKGDRNSVGVARYIGDLENQLDRLFRECGDDKMLVERLSELLCGAGGDGGFANAELLFKFLRERNQTSVCAYQFKRGESAYQCLTCQTDPTCIQCMPCFKEADHTGHEVLMTSAGGGGCCDCGDPESWKPEGFCKRHKGRSHEKIDSREVLGDEVFQCSKAVLTYVVHLLTDAMCHRNGRYALPDCLAKNSISETVRKNNGRLFRASASASASATRTRMRVRGGSPWMANADAAASSASGSVPSHRRFRGHMPHWRHSRGGRSPPAGAGGGQSNDGTRTRTRQESTQSANADSNDGSSQQSEGNAMVDDSAEEMKQPPPSQQAEAESEHKAPDDANADGGSGSSQQGVAGAQSPPGNPQSDQRDAQDGEDGAAAAAAAEDGEDGAAAADDDEDDSSDIAGGSDNMLSNLVNAIVGMLPNAVPRVGRGGGGGNQDDENDDEDEDDDAPPELRDRANDMDDDDDNDDDDDIPVADFGSLVGQMDERMEEQIMSLMRRHANLNGGQDGGQGGFLNALADGLQNAGFNVSLDGSDIRVAPASDPDGDELVAEDSDDSPDDAAFLSYLDSPEVSSLANVMYSPTTRQSLAARGVGDSLLFLHNDEHHSMKIVVDALRDVLHADQDASYLIMSRVHVYDYTLAFAGSREFCERAKRTLSRGRYCLAVTVVHPPDEEDDGEEAAAVKVSDAAVPNSPSSQNASSVEGSLSSSASVSASVASASSSSTSVDNMPMSSRARASLHAQLQRHSSSHLPVPDELLRRQRLQGQHQRATAGSWSTTMPVSLSSENSAAQSMNTDTEKDEKTSPESHGVSGDAASAARPAPESRFVRVARPLIVPESLMVLLVEWLSSLCEVSEAFRDIIHELYKTPLLKDEELLVSPMNTVERDVLRASTWMSCSEKRVKIGWAAKTVRPKRLITTKLKFLAENRTRDIADDVPWLLPYEPTKFRDYFYFLSYSTDPIRKYYVRFNHAMGEWQWTVYKPLEFSTVTCDWPASRPHPAYVSKGTLTLISEVDRMERSNLHKNLDYGDPTSSTWYYIGPLEFLSRQNAADGDSHQDASSNAMTDDGDDGQTMPNADDDDVAMRDDTTASSSPLPPPAASASSSAAGEEEAASDHWGVSFGDRLGQPIVLDLWMKFDFGVSSEVRRGLTELYFRLMIDIEFKKTFALSFFRYYKFLHTYYKELSRATNRQNSVLGISVQLLTIEKLAFKLVREGGLVRLFCDTVLSELRQFTAKRHDGRRSIIDCTQFKVEQLDMLPMVLRDIEYVFHYKDTVKYMLFDNRTVLFAWVRFCAAFDALNPETRVNSRVHREYEDAAWLTAFNLELKLSSAMKRLVGALDECLDDEQFRIDHDQQIHECIQFLVDSYLLLNEDMKYTLMPEYASGEVLSSDGFEHCVDKDAVTFHFASQRVLAALLFKFRKHGYEVMLPPSSVVPTDGRQALVRDRGAVKELAEFPMRLCAAIAHIDAGLWSHNGSPPSDRSFNYHHVCWPSMGSPDFGALQLDASINAELFMANVVTRFCLVEWSDIRVHRANTVDSDARIWRAWPTEKRDKVVDGTFRFLISLLSDRSRVGVQSQQDTLRWRMLQLLIWQPCTHSQLAEHLGEDIRKSLRYQEILSEISTFIQPSDKTPGRFSVRLECIDEFDPYFFFVAAKREAAEDNFKRIVKVRDSKTDQASSPLYPPLPKLFELRNEFINLRDVLLTSDLLSMQRFVCEWILSEFLERDKPLTEAWNVIFGHVLRLFTIALAEMRSPKDEAFTERYLDVISKPVVSAHEKNHTLLSVLECLCRLLKRLNTRSPFVHREARVSIMAMGRHVISSLASLSHECRRIVESYFPPNEEEDQGDDEEAERRARQRRRRKMMKRARKRIMRRMARQVDQFKRFMEEEKLQRVNERRSRLGLEPIVLRAPSPPSTSSSSARKIKDSDAEMKDDAKSPEEPSVVSPRANNGDSSSISLTKPRTCIFCKSADPEQGNLNMLVFIRKSSFLETALSGQPQSMLETRISSESRPAGRESAKRKRESEKICFRFCGHCAHRTCFDHFNNEIKKRRRDNQYFDGVQTIRDMPSGFCCPFCKTVSNAIVPVFPLSSRPSASSMHTAASPSISSLLSPRSTASSSSLSQASFLPRFFLPASALSAKSSSNTSLSRSLSQPETTTKFARALEENFDEWFSQSFDDMSLARNRVNEPSWFADEHELLTTLTNRFRLTEKAPDFATDVVPTFEILEARYRMLEPKELHMRLQRDLPDLAQLLLAYRRTIHNTSSHDDRLAHVSRSWSQLVAVFHHRLSWKIADQRLVSAANFLFEDPFVFFVRCVLTNYFGWRAVASDGTSSAVDESESSGAAAEPNAHESSQDGDTPMSEEIHPSGDSSAGDHKSTSPDEAAASETKARAFRRLNNSPFSIESAHAVDAESLPYVLHFAFLVQVARSAIHLLDLSNSKRSRREENVAQLVHALKSVNACESDATEMKTHYETSDSKMTDDTPSPKDSSSSSDSPSPSKPNSKALTMLMKDGADFPFPADFVREYAEKCLGLTAARSKLLVSRLRQKGFSREALALQLLPFLRRCHLVMSALDLVPPGMPPHTELSPMAQVDLLLETLQLPSPEHMLTSEVSLRKISRWLSMIRPSRTPQGNDMLGHVLSDRKRYFESSLRMHRIPTFAYDHTTGNFSIESFSMPSHSLSVESYVPPALRQLPVEFHEIFIMSHDRKCRACGTIPARPCLCLLCGAYLCTVASYGSEQGCCSKNYVGELTQHSNGPCGLGVGMFLQIKANLILLVADGFALEYPSPYLDEHGEPDRGLKRGKPLTLNPQRWRRLNDIASSLDIYAEVCRQRSYLRRPIPRNRQ